MKFAKKFGLVMFVLAMLLPAGAAVASQGRDRSDKPKADKSEKNDKNPVQSVPEPATLTILGAAAVVVGARKAWQARRRFKVGITKPSGDGSL
jgi:hypothetical protein